MATLRTQTVIWHADDPNWEWLGWLGDKNSRTDEPDFLVKKIPTPTGPIWAGWVYRDEGRRECCTLDYPNASDARGAIEDNLAEGLLDMNGRG